MGTYEKNSWSPIRTADRISVGKYISFFYVALGHLIFVDTLFPLGVLYLEHSKLAFDCVVIASSLESIRPGLVQGCKAPMV